MKDKGAPEEPGARRVGSHRWVKPVVSCAVFVAFFVAGLLLWRITILVQLIGTGVAVVAIALMLLIRTKRRLPSAVVCGILGFALGGIVWLYYIVVTWIS